MAFTTAALIGTAISAGTSLAASSAQSSAQNAAADQQSILESHNQYVELHNLQSERHNSAIDHLFAGTQASINRQTAANQYALAENTAAWMRYRGKIQEKALEAKATGLFQQAATEEIGGRNEVRRQRFSNERLKATQRARYAKSGVVGEAGSPVEVMAETAGLLQLGMEDIKYRSDLRRQDFLNQGQNALYERDLQKVATDYDISRTLAVGKYERDLAFQESSLKAYGADVRLENATRDQNNREWSLLNQPSRVPAMRAQAKATRTAGYANAIGSVASAAF